MEEQELNELFQMIKKLDVKEATNMLYSLSNEQKIELDNYIKEENKRLTDNIEMYREKIVSVREKIYKVRNKK